MSIALETEKEVLDIIRSRGGEAKPAEIYRDLRIVRSIAYFRTITTQMLSKSLIKYDRDRGVFVLGEEKTKNYGTRS